MERDMGTSTPGGFWGNMARCRQGTFMASAFLAIVLGSLAPDFDLLWHGHRGWTHNPYIYVGVCICVSVVAIIGFAFTGRLRKGGVLKWKR